MKLQLIGIAASLCSVVLPVRAVTILEMWDFADPVRSEQRLRDALAGADADWQLELQTQIARTYSLRGRFAEAHRLLDEIEPRLAGARATPRLRYLLERGRTFNSAGDKAAARPLFLQAWELGQAAGEEDLAIDAAHMVAIVEGGEPALDWNRRALALAQSAHDPAARRWRASLLNNMGVELNALGRHLEALAILEQALAAYRERGEARTIRIARWIGRQDNNVAEYVALLEALQLAVTLKATALHVFSDSQVVVRQMRGEYACRSSRLYSLHWICRKLTRCLKFSITHVPRERNMEANGLANSAVRQRLSSKAVGSGFFPRSDVGL